MKGPIRTAIRIGVILAVTTATSGARAASPRATWVIQTSKNPSTTYNELNGVSATSSTNAWAAGFYANASGVYRTLIEHWDGTTWVKQNSPNANTSYNQLGGVKATSSSNAWAVGDFAHSSGFERTLIEHYDGTKWSRQASVSFLNSDNFLHAVAATSTSNAWAVGCYGPGNDFNCFHPLIEHYDGTAWKIQTAPQPCTTQDTDLLGVTATSSSNAWAVGYCEPDSGDTAPVIEHYDGTSWATQSSPSVVALLSGVSASSSTDVWAVGHTCAGFGVGCDNTDAHTLIEHYDGTSWTIVQTPNIGTGSNYLFSVKAISSTNAWAVGTYIPSGTFNFLTLILHWDGTLWSVQSSPNGGTYDDELFGVGASSTTNVFAVGFQGKDPFGTYNTLVEHCC